MSDAPSRLFCPFLDRGEGIYLTDERGKCPSGAMVSNIGHSNPWGLARIRAPMDRATFGYRPHFRTHLSADLAVKASEMPGNAQFPHRFRGHLPMLKVSCSAFLCGRGGRRPGNSEGLLQ